MDKLQTNHKGLFVLADFKFKWIEKYTMVDDSNVKKRIGFILDFACGLIRGATTNLGLSTTVTVDYPNLPGVSFNVRMLSQ